MSRGGMAVSRRPLRPSGAPSRSSGQASLLMLAVIGALLAGTLVLTRSRAGWAPQAVRPVVPMPTPEGPTQRK